jgi:hypothetical protein
MAMSQNRRGIASLLVLVSVILFTLFLSITIFKRQETTPSRLHTYVNESGYSFQYTNSEEVDHGGLVDVQNRNLNLMEVLQATPPVERNFRNQEEMIDEIFRYWSSSTSQYPYPERHIITGPLPSEVKTRDGSTKPMYRYEIAWQNGVTPEEGPNGVHVWLFVHHEDNEFLWLKYDKQYEDRLSPTLQSFTVEK